MDFSKIIKEGCFVNFRVVCPFVLLCSILRTIDNTTISHKTCQASDPNKLQRKIDVDFKKFDSSKLTKTWNTRLIVPSKCT